MQTCALSVLGDPASAFCVDALTRLDEADIPFLVGGTFAFARYAKIERETKDLDVFVKPEDCRRALALFDAAGYCTELPFPHWLGKVKCGEHVMDVIFSSGNGVARVDDLWFERSVDVELFGMVVRVCPAEEMIWSKAFVQERERFDGADVMHLFRELGPALDWDRLLLRFGDHWRVLLAHIVLYGYVYPDRRDQIPEWVTRELARRLAAERPEPDTHICYGPMLSREQYLIDLERFGYRDGRVEPLGWMTEEETAIWTAAIGDKK